MFLDAIVRLINRRHWSIPKKGLRNAARREYRLHHPTKSQDEFASQVASNLRPGMRVVELGCSGGHWFQFLRLEALNCSYTGIDISESVVSAARERFPAAKFVCADVTKINDLSQYDYVLAPYVFQFLSAHEVHRIIKLLPPGTIITISGPSAAGIDGAQRSAVLPLKGKRFAITYAHPYKAMLVANGFTLLAAELNTKPNGKSTLTVTGKNGDLSTVRRL